MSFFPQIASVAKGGLGQTSAAEGIGEQIQTLTTLTQTQIEPAADLLALYDASADTGKNTAVDSVAGLTRAHPGYITNRYYGGALEFHTSTLALTADTLYAIPIYIGKKPPSSASASR